MGSINESKEAFWRKQITLAVRREGSLESFCREQGLSPATLAYWRKKFGAAASKPLALSPFIPVKVEPTPVRATLPDPRWLAELILELVRRQT